MLFLGNPWTQTTTVSEKHWLDPGVLRFYINLKNHCHFLGLTRHSAAFTSIESKTSATLDPGTPYECIKKCKERGTCKIASLHSNSKICYMSGNWMEYNLIYNANNRYAFREGNFSN